MYICQHPENTCVGANCNSPFHMGEFEMWMNFATWMNFAIWDKFAIWANCNSPLRHMQTPSYHAHDVFFVYLHDLYVYLPMS